MAIKTTKSDVHVANNDYKKEVMPSTGVIEAILNKQEDNIVIVAFPGAIWSEVLKIAKSKGVSSAEVLALAIQTLKEVSK